MHQSNDGGAPPQLRARDGDVLVVTYGDVKIPISKYNTVTVGGLIYTRRLVDGDDVQLEHDVIYEFLRDNAERDAREKFSTWAAQIQAARVAERETKAPTAPKPSAAERRQPVAAPTTPAHVESTVAASAGKPKPAPFARQR